MTPKLFVVVFLLATEFGHIQNQQQGFQGFPLWRKNADEVFKIKELDAQFTKEFLPVMKHVLPVEVEREVSAKHVVEVVSKEEQMARKKLKREIAASSKFFSSMESKDQPVNNIKKFNADVSMSSSIELKQSEEDSEELSKLEIITKKPVKVLEQDKTQLVLEKFKRQTSINGNGNRLSNLVNLPIRLKVLANVLSVLSQGVVDNKETPLGAISISGNDNTVSSLINAPIDADAFVNVLGQVDITKSGHPAGADGAQKSHDLVGNLLGGLLGGGGKDKDKPAGLVDGLLGGVLSGGGGGKESLVDGLLGGLLGEDGLLSKDGLLDNLLGDTLGNLLGGLLGGLLDGVDGKGMVSELLDGLLGGVVELVNSLLELLVGVLEGLLQGLAETTVAGAGPVQPQTGGSVPGAAGSLGGAPGGLHIEGNNNKVSALINAPVRINALINALSSLKQEIAQQANPATANTVIQGNNNEISSLINLPINANVKVNVLGSVVEKLSGKPDSGAQPAIDVPSGILAPASPLTHISSTPAPAATSIKGNNNVISSLLNVVPDVNVHLNLLSEITELLSGGSGTLNPNVGISPGSNPNEICFDVPISQAETSITGNNNKISNAVNLTPKINLDLNLLSTVKKTGANDNVPTQRVCIIKPTIPIQPSTTNAPTSVKPAAPTSVTPANPPVTPLTASPNEICFDVLVDQSGTVISGNNNHVSSLVNVNPKINLGLNLLSNTKQTAPQTNLTTKRICIPTTTSTTSIKATPATPHTHIPVIHPPTDTRCYKRTCTKWRQFLDYNCLNKTAEYPKHTLTRDFSRELST